MAVHRCAPDAGGSQAPDPGELGDERMSSEWGCHSDAPRPRRGAAHVSAGQFDGGWGRVEDRELGKRSGDGGGGEGGGDGGGGHIPRNAKCVFARVSLLVSG